VAILQTALGLAPDVPAGVVRLHPWPGSPLGAIDLRGVRIANSLMDVRVDRTGKVAVTGPASGLRVITQAGPRIPTQPREGVLDSSTVANQELAGSLGLSPSSY
jgi:hypothetical protein